MLGDEVFVGEDAVITSNVKVYPFKTVEAGAIINSSIIWESKGARSLFGREGVVGLSNVDMTPELATRVALAFATRLKKDATIVISRDSSRSARMLKRAVMAGLNAGGINVLDLETASVPVTRFVCRQANVSGRTRRSDWSRTTPTQVMIRFFDAEGADIAPEQQRKIERVFAREDFRRVRPADIGDIDLPARALEQYAVSLESTIDVAGHREPRVQGRDRLLVRVDLPRDAQRAGEARRRRAGGQPVRVHRGRARPSTPRSTPRTWPSSSWRAGPTSAA